MSREDFLKEFNIHISYQDFFTKERVKEIDEIFEKIGHEYTPRREDIFNIFSEDLSAKKVLLLGMDPYPQEGIATGFSFEVPYDSWVDKRINTSLKNIIKVIYKTYYGVLPDIALLRDKVINKKIPLSSPKEDFLRWRKNGVIFLNSALTVKVGKPGSHLKYWKNFTRDFFIYIGDNNPHLTYLLWGSDAIKFESIITSGKIIKHKHPTFLGSDSDPNSFRNSTSFSSTMNEIRWLEETE